MALYQNELRSSTAVEPQCAHNTCLQRLYELLCKDLDFHGKSVEYASHGFHSFPAKFPPQLPHLFIEGLTAPGDVVFDPMVGSGTTAVEAFLLGRHAVGADIDPLALLITRVKTTPLDVFEAVAEGERISADVRTELAHHGDEISAALEHHFDSKTREFVDYWFPARSQRDLFALSRRIARVENPDLQAFLQSAFSAVIITKSSGVSSARDLAHTRPHKVADVPDKSVLDEFEKRLAKNIKGLSALNKGIGTADIFYCDAQTLSLDDSSVDLVVTSPPYAANAIDYMRAHKFSLVWFGYPIGALSGRRRDYIGGESTDLFDFVHLPNLPAEIVAQVCRADDRKGRALHRYYSEMTRALREMFRVLRPDRAAIVVVGTSLMRGIDTKTQECLASIGHAVGFEVAAIASRNLNRDRRMMPARWGQKRELQIEQRMHEEFVLGLWKPDSAFVRRSREHR